MQNYTLIVGSAYGDDSKDIYVVLAPSPKAAHDYVKALDAKIKDTPRTVFYIMDGEVSFQSTFFPEAGQPDYGPPTVIDLRPGWSLEPAHDRNPARWPETAASQVIPPPRRTGKHPALGAPYGKGSDLTPEEAAKVSAGAWSTADEQALQARRAAKGLAQQGQEARAPRAYRRKAAEPAQTGPVPALKAAVENLDPMSGKPLADAPPPPMTAGRKRTAHPKPGTTSLISGKPRRGALRASTGSKGG